MATVWRFRVGPRDRGPTDAHSNSFLEFCLLEKLEEMVWSVDAEHLVAHFGVVESEAREPWSPIEP